MGKAQAVGKRGPPAPRQAPKPPVPSPPETVANSSERAVEAKLLEQVSTGAIIQCLRARKAIRKQEVICLHGEGSD